MSVGTLHHDGPASLPLHFLPTREQDPEVLEPLHLGQDLLPDPLFPAEDRGLRFGGAGSHPGRFTVRSSES